MINPNQLTLVELQQKIKSKEISPHELIQKTQDQIAKVDTEIFAYVSINERAKDQLTSLVSKGNDLPLLGIPMAVKDVLSTKGLKTTASSKILENYIPPYDATVVKKLKDAGAIVIGKTNCDSFAFGASTENSGFGITKNPWDQSRVAGGSSGGSAAAVAADECTFALGTDTGGSIRQPSSFCGVTGLKPTYGACSRFGLLAMASSFDCPGPIAKTVEDCRIIFNLMKGRDNQDATSYYKDYGAERKKEKIKIGLAKEFFSEGINEEVKKTVKKAANLLEENGFLIEEISLPHTQYAIATYYILVPSEISSNMARYDGIRFGKSREVLEDEVKRRIVLGTYSLSAGYYDEYYDKAARVRSLITKDYLEAFSKVDVILGPVSPTTAFKIGEKTKNPLEMYLADVLTSSANLAGIPGLALPCGFDEKGLPVGMQILGPHFSEDLLFFIGETYQNLTDWHKKKPNLGGKNGN